MTHGFSRTIGQGLAALNLAELAVAVTQLVQQKGAAITDRSTEFRWAMSSRHDDERIEVLPGSGWPGTASKAAAKRLFHLIFEPHVQCWCQF